MKFLRLICSLALLLGGFGIANAHAETTASSATDQDAGIQLPPGVVPFGTVVPGSGKGITIGFTQLGLGVPFTDAVQKGMEEDAKIAGVKLITCDSKFSAARALDCAREFRALKVNGLVTFQADAAAAASICEAGPKVPVIAVDINQKPCQTAFVGAANTYAGEIVGYALGKYFQQHYNCHYDAWVSLESLAVGTVNTMRMGGMREGFAQVCGKIHTIRIIDTGAGGQSDVAQQQMTDTLTALPVAKRIIVVGINEDVVTGALAAARQQGRSQDLYLGVQGFDPRDCQIWTAPHFVAASDYFPDKYADLIIPNLIKAIKGEKIAPEILVHHELINKDNMLHYYPNMKC